MYYRVVEAAADSTEESWLTDSLPGQMMLVDILCGMCVQKRLNRSRRLFLGTR